MKRLLELLRHDNCDDSVVVCDCSLRLNIDDDDAAPRGADQLPQRSPLRPAEQPTVIRTSVGDQQGSSNDSSPTPADLSYDVDALSGRRRTFRLPDVQVRHTALEQSERVGRPSSSTVAVVSTPDVINSPHYTVV